MLAPAIDRFYVRPSDTPKAKAEGRCRDCNWAYFHTDRERLKAVFLYHYSEIHRRRSHLVPGAFPIG
jgi:hypothetical protein